MKIKVKTHGKKAKVTVTPKTKTYFDKKGKKLA